MSHVSVEPGVTAELARSRAAQIGNLSYALHFSVPEDATQALEGRVSITFDLARADEALQIDFRHGAGRVLTVRQNDDDVPYRTGNEHIVIPPGQLQRGANTLHIEFRAPQDSVNRNPDFLFTLFVPDRARSTFPLFDQPDLRARFTLTLDTPASWQAISNADLVDDEPIGERRRFRFAPTRPIAPYLFSFAAGEFERVSRRIGERSMTLLHRESDAGKLARNIEEVFALHAAALDWLESYTGIDYPFEKFAFVLTPDFPYGGMEHPGAIQYRADALLLDESPPDSRLLDRAQLIAHETAHMWFGNLVTMRWFDDVWTKEVFANFMAGKIVNPAFPNVDHDLNFLVSHYPSALGIDRSAGANPIRQPLDNLNLAGQLYGPIIYHKAPIMMRQLELLLGAERFREGMREYLRRFSFANASWPELIDILNAKTSLDLAAWSQVWVNSPGMPYFEILENPARLPESAHLAVRQTDPRGEGRIWPQRFAVAAAPGAPTRELEVLSSEPLTLGPGAGAAPMLNADGRGYGLFPVAMALFEHWDSLPPLQRGVLLVNGYEGLLAGAHPRDYYELLCRILGTEDNVLLVELAAGQLRYLYFSVFDSGQRRDRARALENLLWARMQAQQDPGMTKLYFRMFADMALSDAALERLSAVWSGAEQPENLSLQEAELIEVAEILAVRIPARSEAILGEQLERTNNTDRRRRLEFIAPALSADPVERDRFFASLADAAHRGTEVWVSDALRRLHDPTRIDRALPYLRPALELVEEIQVTGDIFFPSAWLNATLENHASARAAELVSDFLAARPDYNPQLKMKILQAADPLFRAAAIRSGANLDTAANAVSDSAGSGR